MKNIFLFVFLLVSFQSFAQTYSIQTEPVVRSESSYNFRFLVTRSGAAPGVDPTVTYTVAGVSSVVTSGLTYTTTNAVAADFKNTVLPTGVVTLKATTYINVTVSNDTIIEPLYKGFNITLSGLSAGTLGNTVSFGVIVDDDNVTTFTGFPNAGAGTAHFSDDYNMNNFKAGNSPGVAKSAFSEENIGLSKWNKRLNKFIGLAEKTYGTTTPPLNLNLYDKGTQYTNVVTGISYMYYNDKLLNGNYTEQSSLALGNALAQSLNQVKGQSFYAPGNGQNFTFNIEVSTAAVTNSATNYTYAIYAGNANPTAINITTAINLITGNTTMSTGSFTTNGAQTSISMPITITTMSTQLVNNQPYTLVIKRTGGKALSWNYGTANIYTNGDGYVGTSDIAGTWANVDFGFSVSCTSCDALRANWIEINRLGSLQQQTETEAIAGPALTLNNTGPNASIIQQVYQLDGITKGLITVSDAATNEVMTFGMTDKTTPTNVDNYIVLSNTDESIKLSTGLYVAVKNVATLGPDTLIKNTSVDVACSADRIYLPNIVTAYTGAYETECLVGRTITIVNNKASGSIKIGTFGYCILGTVGCISTNDDKIGATANFAEILSPGEGIMFKAIALNKWAAFNSN